MEMVTGDENIKGTPGPHGFSAFWEANQSQLASYLCRMRRRCLL
jgi:hypothetical protein